MGTAAAVASAPGVLVRVSEAEDESDEAFHTWFHRQMPAPLAVEGIRAARRYRAAGGEPTYMTVYECRSTEVLAEPAARAALSRVGLPPSSWQPGVRDTMQFVGHELWSAGEGLGGSAILVECKPVQGREDAARDFIRSSFAPGLMPALVRMALWEADAALGRSLAPPGAAADGGRRPGAQARRWVLALESHDAARMALAVHALLLACESDKTGLMIGSWTRFQLVCAYGAPVH
jgi:hypothetical protein